MALLLLLAAVLGSLACWLVLWQLQPLYGYDRRPALARALPVGLLVATLVLLIGLAAELEAWARCTDGPCP